MRRRRIGRRAPPRGNYNIDVSRFTSELEADEILKKFKFNSKEEVTRTYEELISPRNRQRVDMEAVC